MANHAIFPGVAGNYFSTEDINLLPADFAHLVQSQPWAGSRGSVADLGIQSDGWGELEFTVDFVDAQARVQTGVVDWAIPDEEVTFSLEVENLNDGDRGIQIRIVGIDAAITGVMHTVPGNTRMRISSSISGLGASISQIWISTSVTPGTGFEVGDTVKMSKFCLSQGSDPTFVPSLRIVGDLDMEADVELADYNVTNIGMFSRSSALDGSYNSWVSSNIANRPRLRVSIDGTSLLDYSFATAGTVPRSGKVLQRYTRIADTGLAAVYYNGELIEEEPGGAGGIFPGTGELYIGGGYSVGADLLDGTLFGGVLRDGIEGPIVACVNIDDIGLTTGAIPDGHTWTDQCGREWTSHGTSMTIVSNAPGNSAFFTLPGEAGAFISTEDVNLLDANTAHNSQAVGSFVNAGSGGVAEWADGPLTPAYGLGYMKSAYYNQGGSMRWPGHNVNGVPVTENTDYSVTVDVNAPVAGETYLLEVHNFMGDGTALNPSVLVDSFVATDADEWFTLAGSLTSKATAEFLTFQVRREAPEGGTISVALDKICVREGVDATFLPSLRIVGGLDTDLDLDTDWGTTNQIWMSKGTSRLTVGNTYNTINRQLYTSVTVAAAIVTGRSSAMPDEVARHKIRVFRDEDSGQFFFYNDGVELGPPNALGAGPAEWDDSPLQVGPSSIPFDAYTISIHDGEDGPVVAKMDAGSAGFPTGVITTPAIWTDQTGRTWTVHGTGVIFTEATSDTAAMRIYRGHQGAGRDIKTSDLMIERHHNV